MRHRVKGRKLGRNSSHRKAMFRNMAASLIRSVRVYESAVGQPGVPGRIVTTVPKAKELRPFVERLVTIGRKGALIEQQAAQYKTDAEPNTDAWQQWRSSEKWNQWNQAIAPAVALRRQAFSLLRDTEAVDVLFDELAERFADRNGGYTRVVRLPKVRLGDSGAQAIIEFVGERDRKKTTKRVAPVVAAEPASTPGEAESAIPSDEPMADSGDVADRGTSETDDDSKA